MAPRKKHVAKNGDGASRDHLVWTKEMDNLLVDALLEEDHRGNRHDGVFSTEAYNNILVTLRTAFGSHLQKENIRNRIKTLKKYFGACKDLFHGLSGFAWNPNTKAFDATNEVWDQLIAEKPEARKWRNKAVHNYDKLFELYNEDRATGEYAESAREKVQRWQTEGTSSHFDLNDSFEHAIFSDSEFNVSNEMHCGGRTTPNVSPTYTHSVNSPEGTSARGTKRKAVIADIIEHQYEKLHMCIEKVANVLEKGNVVAEKYAEKSLAILESGRPHYYREDEIFSELEVIGVHPSFQLTAYCYLSKNHSATRMFFGAPRSRRLELLMKIMNDDSS